MNADTLANRPSASGWAPLRSDLYALLASLLTRPPTADRIRQLERLTAGPEIPARLSASLKQLRDAAEKADVPSVNQEFADLFIGLGRGEIVPYASWYLEKKLMGVQLARLRADLATLNVDRQKGVHEPEDHAAALCEIMVLMIAQTDLSEDRQTAFFQTHLGPWMIRFFKELQQTPSAVFYRSVGDLGEQFMLLEKQFLQPPYSEEG